MFLNISIEPVFLYRGENPQLVFAKRIKIINMCLKMVLPFKLQDL